MKGRLCRRCCTARKRPPYTSGNSHTPKPLAISICIRAKGGGSGFCSVSLTALVSCRRAQVKRGCPPALPPSHQMGIGQPGEQTSRQTRHPSTGSPRTGYWPTASGLVHRRYRGPAGGFCLSTVVSEALVDPSACPLSVLLAEHVASGARSWCGGAVVRWCGSCCAVVVFGGCRRSEKQGSAEPTGVVTQGPHPCCLFLPLGTPPFHTCSIPLFSPVDPSNNLCRASLPLPSPSTEFPRQTTDWEPIHLSPITHRPSPTAHRRFVNPSSLP